MFSAHLTHSDDGRRDVGEGGFLKNHGALVVLLVVLFLGATHDAFLLFRYPVAVGFDGYYYVLQVHELLVRGRLYFPTNTPLVFYPLAGLAALAGDTIMAIKVGSVALHIALCGGLHVLVSSATRSRWSGVLAALIAASSAMHLYMLTEFIKNLCALALLIWCWWAMVWPPQPRGGGRAVIPLLLFIAAILSHKSAWALTLATFAFSALLRRLFTKENVNHSQVWTLFAAALAVLLPALVAIQPLIKLPEWLGKEVLARPQSPISLGSPLGAVETTTLLVLAPLALFLLRRHRDILPTPYFLTLTGGVALWSLLITLNPFLNHDVRQLGAVGRLDHLMHVQLAILIPGLVWLTAHIRHKVLTFLLPLTALFVIVTALSPLPRGLRRQYLLNRSQMLSALPEHKLEIGQNPLIIARHGDEFVVTWSLGVPARQRLPDNTTGHTLYWLLHNVEQSELMTSMIVVMEEEDNSCLALIRHDELAGWLSTMTEVEQGRLLFYNPQLEDQLRQGAVAGAP